MRGRDEEEERRGRGEQRRMRIRYRTCNGSSQTQKRKRGLGGPEEKVRKAGKKGNKGIRCGVGGEENFRETRAEAGEGARQGGKDCAGTVVRGSGWMEGKERKTQEAKGRRREKGAGWLGGANKEAKKIKTRKHRGGGQAKRARGTHGQKNSPHRGTKLGKGGKSKKTTQN